MLVICALMQCQGFNRTWLESWTENHFPTVLTWLWPGLLFFSLYWGLRATNMSTVLLTIGHFKAEDYWNLKKPWQHQILCWDSNQTQKIFVTAPVQRNVALTNYHPPQSPLLEVTVNRHQSVSLHRGCWLVHRWGLVIYSALSVVIGSEPVYLRPMVFD